MKKTFMAMLLVGGTMTVLAQTTPTGTGTTGTTTTTNTTMGTTTDPNSTTTNGTMNATGNWNGVSSTPSTSWAPDRDPSWGWNSYGVWSNGGNMSGNSGMNNNSTTGMNSASGMNNLDMTTEGNMRSTGTYNARGTAVAGLPMNVQMRFNEDFPQGVNNQYAWNQYGDWFHTHQMNNGRLWQYFYDQKGAGYALALPVLQTYVPENIVTSALQKYGSNLYSIAMVKTNNSSNAYQIGLIQGGQVQMEYLDENGATVADVWRTEDMNTNGTMSSTQSNAAMGHGSMDEHRMNNTQTKEAMESKMKIDHADGSETKIKTEKGKTKIKHDN